MKETKEEKLIKEAAIHLVERPNFTEKGFSGMTYTFDDGESITISAFLNSEYMLIPVETYEQLIEFAPKPDSDILQ